MSDTTKTLTGNQYLVTHSVGSNQAGIRLDRFLMDRYTRRSREQIKRIIDSGAIQVVRENSRHLAIGRMKASFALQPGDLVQVLSTRKPEPEVCFDYRVIHEDSEILVIEKPPNLPVHPAGRFFFNTLLIHLKTDGFKTDLKTERNFFLVHRIDKETSGILLLAKNKAACNALTAQFRNRETQKYYLAISRGEPADSAFRITAPIGKAPKGRIGLKMYPRTVEEGGLDAETHFEKIETRTGNAGTFTLMACFPRTGRQHQIRVHAEIAGIPLAGDKVYGLTDDEVLALLEGNRELERSSVTSELIDSEEVAGDSEMEMPEIPEPEEEAEGGGFEIRAPSSSLFAEVESKLHLKRHALHAAGLRFTHPGTGELMTFESNLPEDLKRFYEGLTGQPLAPFRTRHW